MADCYQKVKSISELAEITRCLRAEGKTIVQCHGVFDLLHPGHLRHFETAKREGDVLIVTVTKDQYVNKGPGRPVFNQRLRAESVAAIQSVDYVAINEWPTAVEAILKLRPHVYAKGSEYAAAEDDLTGGIYHEEEAVKSIGGRIHFTTEITFSSSELLNLHFNVYPEDAQAFLKEFRQRYSDRTVIKWLDGLKQLKVLVIGDTIIDEYHYCQPMGKSPKELIISTRYLRDEAFAGGVLACANHLAGFCEDVHLVTWLGRINSREDFIRKHLKSNISAKFVYREDSATIVNRRFVDQAFLTKMFQIYFLDDHNVLPPLIEREIYEHLKEILHRYDLVLVADYGHSMLGPSVVRLLSEEARYLAVNSQTNSTNAGYNLITKYPRADYVCIDEPEIRLACHDRLTPIHELIPDLAKRLQCKQFTVTRGHRGALTYSASEGFFEVPVFSDKIVDRVGAGDAFLSITAPCAAVGVPMDVIGFIGNAVGALAVQIVCNRSAVEPVPLYKFITALLK
jgi:rfaE bifunctional protein nucleotidyltransferase chain/domain